jgi:hypothetical protein
MAPLSQDDFEDEEEDEEVADSDEDEPHKIHHDIILLGAWLLLLVMILLCEIASYEKVVSGDLSLRWRIWLAGVIGFLCAFTIICLAYNLSFPFQVTGACCALMFAIAFITFMFLPVVQMSDLIRVDTVLSVNSTTCPLGNYLDVSELLTFSADPKVTGGTVASAKHGVLRKFKPRDFTVEDVGSVQNVSLVNHRFGSTAQNAIERKTIKFEFSPIVVPGPMPVEFSIRLNYTARLQKSEACVSGTKCGTWIVPGSRTSGVLTSLSVLDGTAAMQEPGVYKVTSEVPGLTLGTDACPYVAENAEYTWT